MTLELGAPPTFARAVSDAFFRRRNLILSSPGFQRWAATFPLTRIIARRRASGLFDLCAGFVYSQVLHAVVQLGVLEAVRDEPLLAQDLAKKLSLASEPTQTLLDAAVSLKLLERRRGRRYGLGIHGASLIANPAIAAMVEHHSLFYRDLEDPVALLRGVATTDNLRRFWGYSNDPRTRTDADVARYTALMSSSLSMLADDILEAYPVRHHERLLDVGGGDGTFLQAAAAIAPDLSLVLFDIPSVAERAVVRLASAGLSKRATVIGGDVFRDALPHADLVSLVRVIHDHDDARAIEILRSIRASIGPKGTLLIAEPMASSLKPEPTGHAYFGLYLLALGQGRPRTPAELGGLLRGAGFADIRERPTRRPLLTRLLSARPN